VISLGFGVPVKGEHMKAIPRHLLRCYLSRCPVTEGKGFLYRTLSELLLPEEREVVVELPLGFRMALDLSEVAQREMYFFGTYERKESALIRRILRPGDVFWDVGANLGYYTLLGAACVGPRGRVVAFEPFPPAWDRLQKNLGLNAFGQVVTFNVAVSKARGKSTLFYEREGPDGVATFIRPNQITASVVCDTLSLDQFLQEHQEPPPMVMKVDVEGWEKAVLDGAERLLASPAQPMLLLEMEDAHFNLVGTSRREIEQGLSRLGYVPFRPKGRRWVVCQGFREVRARSIFWLCPSHPTHLERARAAGILEIAASGSAVGGRGRPGAQG
jgi:FkbM family methyltransferase